MAFVGFEPDIQYANYIVYKIWKDIKPGNGMEWNQHYSCVETATIRFGIVSCYDVCQVTLPLFCSLNMHMTFDLAFSNCCLLIDQDLPHTVYAHAM